MTALAALAWCRDRAARITFKPDGSCAVTVQGQARRRPTLAEAVAAHVEAEAREAGRRL